MKNKFLKIMFLICIFIIFFGIIGFSIYKFIDKRNNLLTGEKYQVYQYFSGIKVDYDLSVFFNKDKYVKSIKFGDKKVNPDNLPIYLKEKNSILLPVNYGLFVLNKPNKSYKLSKYTFLYKDIDNNIYIKNGGKKSLEKSFLYDGKDMYIFPYGASITINDEDIELDSFSYVNVLYNEYVEVYNSKNDEYKIYDDYNKEVYATMGNTKINLSTDVVISNSERRILVSGVNDLENYYK